MCLGDCDADGGVVVAEIVTLINVVLGNLEAASCAGGLPLAEPADVTAIIRAIRSALDGCPAVTQSMTVDATPHAPSQEV